MRKLFSNIVWTFYQNTTPLAFNLNRHTDNCDLVSFSWCNIHCLDDTYNKCSVTSLFLHLMHILTRMWWESTDPIRYLFALTIVLPFRCKINFSGLSRTKLDWYRHNCTHDLSVIVRNPLCHLLLHRRAVAGSENMK